MLIASGRPSSNGRYTEIIDLEDPSFTCSKVNKFPIDKYYATGGLVGQTPFICGGTSGYSRACYTLLENGVWKEDKTAVLNTGRNRAAYGSVIINGKLVLASGLGSSGRVSSIEVVAPNTRSRTLSINVPVAVTRACIVLWDANTFLLIGGSDSQSSSRRETYLINIDNNTISNGPKLLRGRYRHGCQKVTVNGESFIIVAGGTGGAERSTEVLSVANYRNGWKNGKIWICLKVLKNLALM